MSLIWHALPVWKDSPQENATRRRATFVVKAHQAVLIAYLNWKTESLQCFSEQFCPFYSVIKTACSGGFQLGNIPDQCVLMLTIVCSQKALIDPSFIDKCEAQDPQNL